MMRKILLLFMVMSMILFLVGCEASGSLTQNTRLVQSIDRITSILEEINSNADTEYTLLPDDYAIIVIPHDEIYSVDSLEEYILIDDGGRGDYRYRFIGGMFEVDYEGLYTMYFPTAQYIIAIGEVD